MNVLNDNHEELDQLLEGLVEERLTADEVKRLEMLVTTDREACRRYIQFMHLNVSLSRQYQSGNDAQLTTSDSEIKVAEPHALNELARAISSQSENASIRTSRRSSPRPIYRSFAVAASLLLVAGLTAVMMQFILQSRDAVTVAQISHLREAVWQVDGEPIGVGDQLAVGQHLKLVRGTADLTFQNGARLTMMGEGELKLKSEKVCELVKGNISVEVTGENPEFKVYTPSSLITDLGTRFSVSVDGLGQEEVHVFDGKVAVDHEAMKANESPGEALLLTAGEAVSMSAGEVKPIELDHTLLPAPQEQWSRMSPLLVNETYELRSKLEWKNSERWDIVKAGVGLDRPLEPGSGDFLRVTGRIGEDGALTRRVFDMQDERAYRIDFLIRVPKLSERGQLSITGRVMEDQGDGWRIGCNWGLSKPIYRKIKRNRLNKLKLGETVGWQPARWHFAEMPTEPEAFTDMLLKPDTTYSISIIIDPSLNRWAARIRQGTEEIRTSDDGQAWLPLKRNPSRQPGGIWIGCSDHYEIDNFRIVRLEH